MLTIAGIDGIKMVSNLGGLPNIFIIAGGIVCVLIIACNVDKYNLVDRKAESGEEDLEGETGNEKQSGRIGAEKEGSVIE